MASVERVNSICQTQLLCLAAICLPRPEERAVVKGIRRVTFGRLASHRDFTFYVCLYCTCLSVLYTSHLYTTYFHTAVFIPPQHHSVNRILRRRPLNCLTSSYPVEQGVIRGPLLLLSPL